LHTYQNRCPLFLCVLGFTQTGLRDNISTAGATPRDRLFTALADGEFLSLGATPNYPLPPLSFGASPVYISRAVTQACQLPLLIFNAGLLTKPPFECFDLEGQAAECVSTGSALPLEVVEHLWRQGWQWGEKLTQTYENTYLILGECVVGGTTTALAVLTGLGIEARGKVNSSHRLCNHEQKWQVVQEGLEKAGKITDPFSLVAAVGDPMQIVVAALALRASASLGILLAGGTQMLAVYALMQALARDLGAIAWENIVVGTTRWVVEDPSGDTVGLARQLEEVPLLATALRFSTSSYPQLQVYEQGYVKEGVGAGGCAIAASLYRGWDNQKLLRAIESLLIP
jgi:uncharacterized protein (TIGR00303 family)